MPNWCVNNLNIYGPEDELKKFVDGATPSDNAVRQYGGRNIQILSTYYPIPTQLQETTATHVSAEPHERYGEWLAAGDITQEQYDEYVAHDAKIYQRQQANLAEFGHTDWYDWANAKWGTKWGDCDTYVQSLEDGEVSISFQSAWSPPIEGLAHVSSLFPNFSFVLSFTETGMGFVGAASFRDGKVVFSHSEETPEPTFDFDDVEGWENYDVDIQDQALKLHLAAAAALGPVSTF